MTKLTDMTLEQLEDFKAGLEADLELAKGNRVKLDLTRGKPAADQLDLSAPMDHILSGDYRAADGTDVRNYGGLRGLPEARQLGAELMDCAPEQVVCWGNSSLTLMYLTVDTALRFGLWQGERAWNRHAAPKLLAPVPGYDRHFTLTESLDIELVNVTMTDQGPDMDQVEALVRDDASVKGIWCVPKYSNPTGCIYSDEVVERMARLPELAAADDFLVLWDNAYAVHDLEFPPARLAPLMTLAGEAGTADHVVMFGSTSKITYAGAGLGFVAATETVLTTLEQRLGTFSIGPDKVNQLRHVAFLADRLEDSDPQVRHNALVTLGQLEPAALAQHAGSLVSRLEHMDSSVRTAACMALRRLEPHNLVHHAHAVIARLDDCDGAIRWHALATLRQLEPAKIAQHADAVIRRLDDTTLNVRRAALATLWRLDAADLVGHAHALRATLEDTDWHMRSQALRTLGKLAPGALAESASAAATRLDDAHAEVRQTALETLGKLERAALLQHADALVARLEDVDVYVRRAALEAFGKLGLGNSGTQLELVQHARAVVARLEDGDPCVRKVAERILRSLPLRLGAQVDFDSEGLRLQLLGRLAWYSCRLRIRVERLALYWYALPYRPSGPGFARDAEAWGTIVGE